MPQKTVVYASVGPELTQYDLDVDKASLTRRGAVSLPANVHYAWPHASRRFLYVASSDSASGIGGTVGQRHNVSALRIDPASGALSHAWRPDRAADPADPYDQRHSLAEPIGRLQQSERVAGLSGQRGWDARRGNRAAGAGRSRHLRAPGADQPRQPAGDPGHPRPRRGRGQARGAGRAQGVPLSQREFDQRGFGRSGRRLWLWPASSRFSSEEPVGLCVARTAEPARHVRARRRGAVARAAVHQRHLGRARQYSRTAGRRHGPRPPERPLRLCRQSRFEHGRGGRSAGLRRRREHAGGLCDRRR